MKRIVSVILAVLLMISLSACDVAGGSGGLTRNKTISEKSVQSAFRDAGYELEMSGWVRDTEYNEISFSAVRENDRDSAHVEYAEYENDAGAEARYDAYMDDVTNTYNVLFDSSISEEEDTNYRVVRVDGKIDPSQSYSRVVMQIDNVVISADVYWDAADETYDYLAHEVLESFLP